VDKDQCGWWCSLALKVAVTGLVLQVRCRGFQRRAGLGWSKLNCISLEREAFLCFFRVYNSGFHALLREKSSLFKEI
jgi:hypothetical protein